MADFVSCFVLELPSDASLALFFLLCVPLPVGLNALRGIRQIDQVPGALRSSRLILVQVVPPLHHVVEMVVVLGHMAEVASFQRL